MIQWKTMPNVTDEQLDDPDFPAWFNSIVREIEQDKQIKQQVINERYENMMIEVEYLWGQNSNEYKYLRRAQKPSPASVDKKIKAVWRRYSDRIEAKKHAAELAEKRRIKAIKDEQRRLQRAEEERQAAIAEEQRLAAQREERRQYEIRRDEAVYILTEKGYIPDQDFTRSNAISFLKKINDEKKSADEEAELLRIQRLDQFEKEATSYEA